MHPQTPVRPTPGLDTTVILRAIGQADGMQREYIRLALPVAVAALAVSALTGLAGTGLFLGLLGLWWSCGFTAERSWVSGRSADRGSATKASLLGAATVLVIVLVVAAGYPENLLVLVTAVLGWITILIGVSLISRKHNNERREALRSGPPLDTVARDSTLREATEWSTVAATPNVQIYSEYYPFTSSVDESRSWSLTVDLNQPERSAEPTRQIDPSAALALFARHLSTVGVAPLRIAEFIFVRPEHMNDVSGMSFGPGGRLVPTAPTSALECAERGESRRARPYLQLAVIGETGLPVLTTFVRFAIDGKTLYIEAFHCPGRWIRADLLDTRAPVLMPTAGATAIQIPRDFIYYLNRRRRSPGRAKEYLANYSPTWSMMDVLPLVGPPTYFARADIKEYVEMIDRQILSTTSLVLSIANVDSSEFSARKMQVFNNSTIISNNSITGSAVAISHRA
jgi:hypothetical protein